MCSSMNGCPWDEDKCWQAAGCGSMAILKYARENRCPWDKEMCLFNTESESVRAWIRHQPR